MKAVKLFFPNPFNDEHIRMVEEFEQRNPMAPRVAEKLRKIKVTANCGVFQEEQKTIEQDLFLESESKIIDSCHINYQKDIKLCTLTFPPSGKQKIRPLLYQALDYALGSLETETATVLIDQDDKNMCTILKNEGLEDLGNEQGFHMFLQEKENFSKKTRTF